MDSLYDGFMSNEEIAKLKLVIGGLNAERHRLMEAAKTPSGNIGESTTALAFASVAYFLDTHIRTLTSLISEPEIKKQDSLQVGDTVRVHYSSGGHLREGRIGTVIELPGPSEKYEGRPAERIEVRLHATIDDKEEIIWSDNDQYGSRLEVIKKA